VRLSLITEQHRMHGCLATLTRTGHKATRYSLIAAAAAGPEQT